MRKNTMLIRDLLDKCSITKSGDECGNEVKDKIISFVDAIYDDKMKIIFRYVGNNILLKEYNCGLNDISLLSQSVFLFGDKAKLFYDDLNQKSRNLSIDEIDKRNFEFIYDKFVKIFMHTEKLDSMKTKEALYKSNDYLYAHQYFSNESKESWTNKIMKLKETKRQMIKDYYVSYLHTIGLTAYGRNTYFLSTSTDYNFCNELLNNNLGFCQEGLIFVGWAKQNETNNILSKQIEKLMNKNNLPRFNKNVFPDQKEITLKCGLLPHFIIGYFYRNKFEINPYMLNAKEKDIPAIVKNGFDIDQKNFHAYFSKTNFRDYFDCDGNQYFQFPGFD